MAASLGPVARYPVHMRKHVSKPHATMTLAATWATNGAPGQYASTKAPNTPEAATRAADRRCWESRSDINGQRAKATPASTTRASRNTLLDGTRAPPNATSDS